MPEVTEKLVFKALMKRLEYIITNSKGNVARLRPIDVVKSDHALQKRPRVAFYMAKRIMKEYGLYPSLVDLHNGKTKVQWVFPISVLKQVYEKMKEEESQQITKAKY